MILWSFTWFHPDETPAKFVMWTVEVDNVFAIPASIH